MSLCSTAFLKVDGELWDLERPLEKSVKLELLDFEHPEGQKFKIYWVHSSHDWFREESVLALVCPCTR